MKILYKHTYNYNTNPRRPIAITQKHSPSPTSKNGSGQHEADCIKIKYSGKMFAESLDKRTAYPLLIRVSWLIKKKM
ncbi:MAG: hypothetical protein EA358_04985 [Flavobacteriales bacterium]|nr:MAG: hypothetical protein EA358_04985 [Flavobacteriales bacterium]